MQASEEIGRALGKYRSAWINLILENLLGVLFIGCGLATRSSIAPLWIGTGVAFLAIAWFVPATIINLEGFRIVWQFKFIPWTDVSKVFEPGPGDPDTRIQLSSGKRVVLPGVGRDRLPGIVLLATAQAGARE